MRFDTLRGRRGGAHRTGRDGGGQVADDIDAAQQRLQGVRIADVDHRNPFGRPRGGAVHDLQQRVDRHHLMARGAQGAMDVRADESGRTGQQYAHDASPTTELVATARLPMGSG